MIEETKTTRAICDMCGKIESTTMPRHDGVVRDGWYTDVGGKLRPISWFSIWVGSMLMDESSKRIDVCDKCIVKMGLKWLTEKKASDEDEKEE